jgi:UDP-3-O-[3-hydroxymyristoyl] glucosamine N-acyltransferase
MRSNTFYVHPTAEVSTEAHIGTGRRMWRQAHIREHAQIGETCNIGKGVYIDRNNTLIGWCASCKQDCIIEITP